MTLCGFGNTYQKFARLLGADRLTNPFAFPLLEFSMRTFLGFFGILSALMAPVSFFCWVAGSLELDQMVVFVLAFFGLAFLILLELEYTPD